MDKTNNNLDKRYNDYSSEKLLEIVIEKRVSYTSEALLTAEKVLTARGVNWKEMVANSPESSIDEEFEPRQLELPNQNVFIFNNAENNETNLTNRIDDLVEDVENNDKEISDNFKTQYENLKEEELLVAYQKVVSEILDKDEFGSVNEQTSIDNYEIIVEEVTARELDLDNKNFSEKAKTVNEKHYQYRSKEIKWKVVLSYIFGTLLILFGLFLLVYAFAMYGLPSIKGILVVIAGGRLIMYANKLKKRRKDFRQRI